MGVVSATELSNDTTGAAYDEVADISDTTLTDTNGIVDEVVQDTSIVTEEVQEKSIKDNRIIKNNIQNVKSASKTYEVNNYDDFRTAVSGRDFDSVTININSDITLTNSLTISTDLYSLNINGKGHTINGGQN